MTEVKGASLGRRLGAYIIDNIIVAFFGFIANGIILAFAGPDEVMAVSMSPVEYGLQSTTYRLGLIVPAVIFPLYGILLESGKKSSTWGKRAMKLVVAKKDGTAAGGWDIISRNCIKYIASILIAIFPAFFMESSGMPIISALTLVMVIIPLCNSKHRALHDFVGDTIVIHRDDLRSNSLYETIPELNISLPTVDEIKTAQEENEPYVKTVSPLKNKKLVCIAGQYEGASFPLDDDLIMGREPGRCNIIFEPHAEGISRVHCKLSSRHEEIYLEDLHSSYGVVLNGRRIKAGEAIALRAGDKFILGKNEVFTLR